ncbi:MAG: contractile injection system tape measure protein, partial [Bacteroidota bacterium]
LDVLHLSFIPPWKRFIQEKQTLHIKVMTSHLSEFLSSMQRSGKEKEILGKWVELLSFREFNQVITQLAPNIASFVVMFLRAVEGAAEKEFPLFAHPERTKVFFFSLFTYVKGRSTSFSATEFVGFALHQLADSVNLSYEKVAVAITGSARSLLEKGETKFSILTEVLKEWKSMEGTIDSLDEWIATQHSDATVSLNVSYQQTGFEEVLQHYLMYGSLPVGSEIAGYDQLLEAFNSYSMAHPERMRKLLQRFLTSSLATRKLVNHGLDLVTRISAFLLKIKVEELASWVRALPKMMEQLLPQSLSKTTFEYLAVEAMWKYVAATYTSSLDLFELTNRYFRGLASSIPGFQRLMAEALRNYDIPAHTPVAVKKALENVGSSKEDQPPVPPAFRRSESEMLSGHVQVGNSGLVLVANFLTRYFDMLKMVEARQFKTPEVAARAVLLTHYLVTGVEEAPEQELVLNKVICGVPVQEPVSFSLSLSDNEKEISESLLKGVLQNWSRMSHISVEALREGFLVRPGQLMENEAQWMLEVESSAIDLLLDTLPWSFKTIKLPWMEKNLNVKWGK